MRPPAGAALAVAFAAWSAAAEPLDTSICRMLPQYVPSGDVTYTPGVDVRGRPVAPADVHGSADPRIAVPLDMPLTLGLARRLGLRVPPSAAALGPYAEIGRLSLYGDVLLYNGQPIGELSQSELIALCRSPPAN